MTDYPPRLQHIFFVSVVPFEENRHCSLESSDWIKQLHLFLCIVYVLVISCWFVEARLNTNWCWNMLHVNTFQSANNKGLKWAVLPQDYIKVQVYLEGTCGVCFFLTHKQHLCLQLVFLNKAHWMYGVYWMHHIYIVAQALSTHTRIFLKS